MGLASGQSQLLPIYLSYFSNFEKSFKYQQIDKTKNRNTLRLAHWLNISFLLRGEQKMQQSAAT